MSNFGFSVFFEFSLIPPHLAVTFQASEQEKCIILQQYVQSTDTQPMYALQACMEGKYMCA